MAEQLSTDELYARFSQLDQQERQQGYGPYPAHTSNGIFTVPYLDASRSTDSQPTHHPRKSRNNTIMAPDGCQSNLTRTHHRPSLPPPPTTSNPHRNILLTAHPLTTSHMIRSLTLPSSRTTRISDDMTSSASMRIRNGWKMSTSTSFSPTGLQVCGETRSLIWTPSVKPSVRSSLHKQSPSDQLSRPASSAEDRRRRGTSDHSRGNSPKRASKTGSRGEAPKRHRSTSGPTSIREWHRAFTHHCAQLYVGMGGHD